MICNSLHSQTAALSCTFFLCNAWLSAPSKRNPMYGIKHLSTVEAENHPSWNATSTMNVSTNQKNRETATQINGCNGRSTSPMAVSTQILSLSHFEKSPNQIHCQKRYFWEIFFEAPSLPRKESKNDLLFYMILEVIWGTSNNIKLLNSRGSFWTLFSHGSAEKQRWCKLS